MKEEFIVSYETSNSSSYMTVSVQDSSLLIPFELGMIVSNKIRHFLNVRQQIVDGKTVLYYDITSLMPLSQVLSSRRLTKEEALAVLQSAIESIRDMEGYHLTISGLVLDPEYIYVNPANCSPSFFFIPSENTQSMDLKDLLGDLVLKNKIAMSNDNFIQILLAELNRQPFSFKEMEKSLRKYQMYGNRGVIVQPAPAQGTEPADKILQESLRENRQNVMQKLIPDSHYSAGESGGVPAQWRPSQQEEQIFSEFDTINKEGETTEKNQKKNKKDQGGSDVNRKWKFIIPQIAIPILLGIAMYFGLFLNKEGGIDLTNIAVFAIVVALFETVLYREMFVNKRKEDAPKAENGKKAMADAKGGKPPIPGSRPQISSHAAPQPAQFPQSVQASKRNSHDRMHMNYAQESDLPVHGAYPPRQNAPMYPPQQNAPMYPQQQNAPMYPQQQNAPMYPPQQNAPMYPPQQNAPMYPPQQNVQSYPSQQNVQMYSPQGNMQQVNQGYDNQSMLHFGMQNQMQSHSVGGNDSGYHANTSHIADAFRSNSMAGNDETEVFGGYDMGADVIANAYLEYFDNGKTQRIPLDRSENGILIGRLSEQVNFSVRSPRVGKVHARFFCQNGIFYVVDINSKNGTYINGNTARIVSNIPQPIRDKDRIMLADCEFTLRCPQ